MRPLLSYATFDPFALHDPLVGGVWIQNPKENAIGTMSCMVVGPGGKHYILSNYHVMTLGNGYNSDCKTDTAIGDDILSPPKFDKTGHPLTPRLVGKVAKSVCPTSNIFNSGSEPKDIGGPGIDTYYDAALAEPKVRYSFDIQTIGLLQGEINPEVGMNVTLVGANSGVTHGKISQIGYNYKIKNAVGTKTKIVKNVFIHTCPSIPGDSGAIIVDDATHKAVGLHFAGADKDPNFNVGCLATYIAHIYGVSFKGLPGVFDPNKIEIPPPSTGGGNTLPINLDFIREKPFLVGAGIIIAGVAVAAFASGK